MKRQHVIALIMSLVLLLLIGVLFVPVPDRMICDCVRGNHYTLLKWISRIRPDNRLRIMKDAFHYDNPEVVQILLDNGTDVNMEIYPRRYDIKKSLLWVAARRQAYECTCVLLDNGANINKDSYAILTWLAKRSFSSLKEQKLFEKCMNKLKEHGVNINCCYGGTVLHHYFAFILHDIFVYDVYIKHGFDPRIKDSKGLTISDIIKSRKFITKEKKEELLKRIEKDVEDLNKRKVPVIKNPACPNIYYD